MSASTLNADPPQVIKMNKSEPIWEGIFYLRSKKKNCQHWWRTVAGESYLLCCRKGCGAKMEAR